MFIFQNLSRIKTSEIIFGNTFKFFRKITVNEGRFLGNGQKLRIRRFHVDTSQIPTDSSPKITQKTKFGQDSTYNGTECEKEWDSLKEESKSPQYPTDWSHRRLKLSKKTIRNIRSIERLYKAPKEEKEVDLDSSCIIEVEIPLEKENNVSEPGESYELVKKLVQDIYKSSSDGVYNDALWNRYCQKLRIVASLLQPNDVSMVLHSFSKIRYKDNNTLKVLFPLLVKHVGKLSCRGLSLVMNALKRLEVPEYDIIDIVTNEFCNNMDKANVQDISLVANSLSFFQIYHIKFWNSLYNSLLIRHHQIDPLQAALILASVSKLDIRKPLMLKILKKRLRPAIENKELSPALVSLVYHSLAKLDFEARYFYASCVNSFEDMLLQGDVKVDSQALVLFLYTSVCLLEPRLKAVERSLRLLSDKTDYLKSYKIIKLKYVMDHLNHKYREFVEEQSDELKEFFKKIKDYRIKRMQKKLSRWAFEVSKILTEAKVDHKRSVLFDYLYADIYIKDFNFVIKCTGPYSYYTKSSTMTKFAKVEQETFALKGFNLGVLPYYEWNRLKSNQDKLEYLKKFGELSASSLYKG